MQLAIEKLQWKDVRSLLFNKNPALAKIIDQLDPPARYLIYKVTYPFGSEILKNGHLYLPHHNGKLISIFDEQVPSAIRSDLGYNLGSNPVSILIRNSAEIFMRLGQRIIPLYGLIPEGKLFGLWRVLSQKASHNPTFLWGMTAGARSLFMLPKISNEISFKKLCRALHMNIDMPKNLDDHWTIFKEIGRNAESPQDEWVTEILFFSHFWFQSFHDSAWQAFHYYCLQEAWDGSEYWRNQYIWDLVYSFIQERKQIKISPHIINTVKHLLSMGEGALPGFAPAVDESAGPIYKIQQVYTEHYNLKYAPIIMEPHFFHFNTLSRPIYYSLQYPTSIEFSTKSNELSSKITDLSQISSLLNKFIHEIKSNKLNLEETPLYKSCKVVNYDFFHTDADNYFNMKFTSQIPADDPYFIGRKSLCRAKEFPNNSPFLRGCIRISTIIS